MATDDKVYILDFEKLVTLFKEEDFKQLSKILICPEIVKVGFGLAGDIKLLAQSSSHLSNISKSSKSLLNLETKRSGLMSLLGLGLNTSSRGLSGLVLTVLGLPLDKSDQISDWSRRPLRGSQLVYAATYAYVCLHLFRTVRELAREKGREVEESLEKLFKGTLTPAGKVELGSCEQVQGQGPPPVPLNNNPVHASSLRLVCDDMLKGLCRRLRLLGLDCVSLEAGQDHLQCVVYAEQGDRYVLSRGAPAKRIANTLPEGHCLDIRSNLLDQQVEEVFKYFCVDMLVGKLGEGAAHDGNKYVPVFK